MIVHNAAGLQKGIDNGRAAEPDPFRFKRLGQAAGHTGLRGHRCRGAEGVLHRVPVGVLPDEIGKSLAVFDPLPGAGRLDRGLDLAPVADDPCVAQQHLHLGFTPAGNGPGIESGKGRPEGRALAQDGDPGQARLKPVQHQLFPQRTAVAFRHAPFGIMIGNIDRVDAAPGAPGRFGGWPVFRHFGVNLMFTAVAPGWHNPRSGFIHVDRP